VSSIGVNVSDNHCVKKTLMENKPNEQ